MPKNKRPPHAKPPGARENHSLARNRGAGVDPAKGGGFCDICQVSSRNAHDLKTHMGGARHRNMAKIQADQLAALSWLQSGGQDAPSGQPQAPPLLAQPQAPPLLSTPQAPPLLSTPQAPTLLSQPTCDDEMLQQQQLAQLMSEWDCSNVTQLLAKLLSQLAHKMSRGRGPGGPGVPPIMAMAQLPDEVKQQLYQSLAGLVTQSQGGNVAQGLVQPLITGPNTAPNQGSRRHAPQQNPRNTGAQPNSRNTGPQLNSRNTGPQPNSRNTGPQQNPRRQALQQNSRRLASQLNSRRHATRAPLGGDSVVQAAAGLLQPPPRGNQPQQNQPRGNQSQQIQLGSSLPQQIQARVNRLQQTQPSGNQPQQNPPRGSRKRKLAPIGPFNRKRLASDRLLQPQAQSVDTQANQPDVGNKNPQMAQVTNTPVLSINAVQPSQNASTPLRAPPGGDKAPPGGDKTPSRRGRKSRFKKSQPGDSHGRASLQPQVNQNQSQKPQAKIRQSRFQRPQSQIGPNYSQSPQATIGGFNQLQPQAQIGHSQSQEQPAQAGPSQFQQPQAQVSLGQAQQPPQAQFTSNVSQQPQSQVTWSQHTQVQISSNQSQQLLSSSYQTHQLQGQFVFNRPQLPQAQIGLNQSQALVGSNWDQQPQANHDNSQMSQAVSGLTVSQNPIQLQAPQDGGKETQRGGRKSRFGKSQPDDGGPQGPSQSRGLLPRPAGQRPLFGQSQAGTSQPGEGLSKTAQRRKRNRERSQGTRGTGQPGPGVNQDKRRDEQRPSRAFGAPEGAVRVKPAAPFYALLGKTQMKGGESSAPGEGDVNKLLEQPVVSSLFKMAMEGTSQIESFLHKSAPRRKDPPATERSCPPHEGAGFRAPTSQPPAVEAVRLTYAANPLQLQHRQADRQADPQHRQADPQHRQADPQHRQVDPQHRQADPQHRQADPQHRQADPQHRQADPQIQHVFGYQHRQGDQAKPPQWKTFLNI